MPVTLEARIERWPIAGSFAIARGAVTEVVTVVVELTDGRHRGRGECRPYSRYGETPDGVKVEIDGLGPEIAAGLDRAALQARLPAGAARNALDCAFWDLEAKRAGATVAALAGLPEPAPLVTAYTLSLGTPESMRAAAETAAARPLLKVKLGGADDLDPARIAAVRDGAPDAELIVDANEGWTGAALARNLAACAEARVTLVEQPLPAADDALLATIDRPIPVCADESGHDRAGLAHLLGRYDAINVKLDKTGGLTEALALAADAQDAGLTLMVGCMLASSLAMAPAVLVAQGAAVVDLDGPLLLARDREHGLVYEGSLLLPPSPALWG
ncbi:L-alanine-DL-glutamate epimerase-like enolase superfamily enzyme [Methylopila capsulata]|uniref:Dipeptide epimerase n=1 Tax=Methylopila capsulata TaxID=61654 RepID=A0A9W6MRZ8_9HYPH|nr:N-acetyl-D-Glu racemase DgcA [Methylopila capsulata]MBM7850431.1 L-alanine-DL-glutamate epimerase-like enolase superfamily enzyme [Methylopila capsulata]GLK55724.1 dipeptide epimerase [Methylopila capsulata]